MVVSGKSWQKKNQWYIDNIKNKKKNKARPERQQTTRKNIERVEETIEKK